MKLFLYLLSFLFANAAFSQQSNCNCSQALQNLIIKVETEYPGFAEKTKDSLFYNSFKTSLEKEIAHTSTLGCFSILKKYVSYFKDRHLWVSPNDQQPTGATAVNTASEIFTLDIKKFKKEIVKSKDALEGIWKNDAYEIGIKKRGPDEYVGFIISADPKYWKPNEIKFRLFSNGRFEYKMQDHSVQKGNYTLEAQTLLYFKEILTELVKQTPEPTLSAEDITNKINELNGFYCKRLTAKTTILKLSNFSYPFVDPIEKLIEKHKDILQTSENLIIDIRGNGGGTDDAYQKILPYILTNPTRYIRTEHLSTPAFISNLKNYNASLTDKEKYQEQIAENEKKIRLLEANPGRFVNFSGNAVVIDTINVEPKSPKQIVFLTNNKVASAAENFLLAAKQSRKVKVMGTPTSGVLDYANVYRFNDFACLNYQLYMPTYRSLRLPDYPIDNIGIQPDVYLDKTVENWEKFTVEYLEYGK
ncbi:MAG: S41 family peptidase [Ferruginibacter sp.]